MRIDTMSFSILYSVDIYMKKKTKWWEKTNRCCYHVWYLVRLNAQNVQNPSLNWLQRVSKLEIKWTQSDRNRTKPNQTKRNRYIAYVHILILTSVFDFHTRANRKFVSILKPFTYTRTRTRMPLSLSLSPFLFLSACHSHIIAHSR